MNSGKEECRSKREKDRNEGVKFVEDFINL